MQSLAPVVFVHGLIGSLQTPDLSAFFAPGRIAAPDLLGYGALADVPPTDLSLVAQVEHLHASVQQHFADEPVHLVGHSVGWVVAALFARRYAKRVKSLVSVEGNFTLRDAFWSASVARMQLEQVEEMLDGFRRDPAAWLEGAGVAAEPRTLAVARSWLAQQPASTLRAMAQAVVEETAAPAYLDELRQLFASHPLHLLAGQRSQAGWDVPQWAYQAAASQTVIADCGHLLMLEKPEAFAQATIAALASNPRL